MRAWRVFASAGLAGVAALAATLDGGRLSLVAAAIALAGALPWYPRSPRAAAVVAVVALQASLPFADVTAVVAILAGLNAYGVGRYCDGPVRLIAGALMLVTDVEVGANSAAPYLFAMLGPLAAGWEFRNRALASRRLAEQGAELHAEREIFAELSVRYERARIAAELHDIVAHAISVMVVQASAGQRLAARDPELTREAFADIAAAARHAEADMGRLLALLTDGHENREDADLTFVRELVARAAATGLDVTLRLEGDRSMAPSAAYRSAYLIVREGLTNALRYASGGSVRVTVLGTADALSISVRNNPPERASELIGHGSGRGLQGLRERLDACSGRLFAGPTSDGGWLLEATLPIAAATEPLTPSRPGSQA
jgi:signal transduction histidine kinase